MQINPVYDKAAVLQRIAAFVINCPCRGGLNAATKNESSKLHKVAHKAGRGKNEQTNFAGLAKLCALVAKSSKRNALR
ncbi:hypothetical protein C7N43_28270 [Sphingobacteriales bacterium UPWRP_1]|nr:hypothetical protein BVG80_18165 [Sphingobacteriales bacterium TSM_CSM]PSJ73605.1 hypothetical protein C7N43_28270 [Sphingobacteriales bacterium UPWRP_1]